VTTRKLEKIIQSAALHFYIPTIEGFFFDPLIKLTIKAKLRVPAQSKCTRQGIRLLLSLFCKL